MPKKECENQVLTSIKGCNSVLICQTLPICNPKTLLLNINSHSKFKEDWLKILPAESENDALTDGRTYRWTGSPTLEHIFLNEEYNIKPRTFFKVAGYKNMPDCLICFSKKWPEMLVFSLILKDYFEESFFEKKISRQQKYAADNQSSNLLLIFSPERQFSPDS